MVFARGKAPLFLLALLLLTALAYWPGLSGSWIFDDDSHVVRQTAIRADAIDAELFQTAVGGFQHGSGRPVAMVTLAIDHVFWRQDPWGYKFTNLVVHLLNALLVFLLVRRLLDIAWPGRDKAGAAAFAIAAIWALHPLQVSTVHYVIQRMEMLATTFVLLALLAYLAGRRRQIEGGRGWPWLAACIPLIGLGVLSKENAALFPAYALVLELTLLGFAARSDAVARSWKVGYAVGVTAAAAVALFVVLPRYSPDYAWAIRDFDMGDRLLTQLRVLPMYLGWIVLPRPGAYVFYYDNFAPSRGWLEPWTTLAGAALIAALLVAAFAARRRMPLFSLGILWFFASHAITSSFLPFELVFEHRNYFGILAVALAGADLYFRLPASEIPRIRPFAVGVVVVALVGLTLIRSATWGQPLNLAMALAQKNPGSSRASMDLGEQYMFRANRDPQSRYYRMAIEEFERGSRVPNASPMPEQGLIVLAAVSGQPADPAWWDRVVHKFQTRPIGPQEMSMVAGMLRKRKEFLVFDDRRFAEVYLVMANRSRMPPYHFYALGEHALEYVGDRPLAKDLFIRAVEFSVGQPEFVAAMADALLAKGEPEMAAAVAERARELDIADITLPAAAVAPRTAPVAPPEPPPPTTAADTLPARS